MIPMSFVMIVWPVKLIKLIYQVGQICDSPSYLKPVLIVNLNDFKNMFATFVQ